MSKIDLLPLPDGFSLDVQLDKLLIQMPSATKTTAAGIIMVEETKRGEQIDSMMGKVIGVGPLAYTDTALFGENPEPACKVGDWVLIKKYSGNKLYVDSPDGEKIELRIVLDDAILGTTKTPEMIRGS